MKKLGLIIYLIFLVGCQANLRNEPIKIGVLHSQTGTMAISEQSVIDATLLAVEEINAKGGVLGRRIEPLVVDGKSDWLTFAEESKRLINEAGVVTIFGCWTSACRKTVKPVFEAHNHLLIYPVQYEGLETSPNIIYTGAAPNQQIIPAVKWSLDNLGQRFFLVGSDYVFPRTANEIIKTQVNSLQGEIVGEMYLPLGSTAVDDIVAEIVATQPDVILNTINGDSNASFFKALRQAGITPNKIPTVSFSIAENELQSLDVESMAGDYAVWNYFQSVDRPENVAFVARFQNKYGANRVISDPMEAAYFGVYLWAQAVERADRVDVSAIREAMLSQSMNAPQGVVVIDPKTQHTWKTVRVGQIQPDGQFEIIWSSDEPIRPVPYPLYKSQTAWQLFLDDLYTGWGGHWASPVE